MDLPDQRMLCCVWSSGGSFSEDTMWLPTGSCRNPDVWVVHWMILRLDPDCSFMVNPTHAAKQLAKNPLLSCPGRDRHRSEEGWDFHWKKKCCPSMAWDSQQPRVVFATMGTAGIAASIWSEVRLFYLEGALHSACLVAMGGKELCHSRPQAQLCGELCRESTDMLQGASIGCFSFSNPPQNVIFSKRNFWQIKLSCSQQLPLSKAHWRQ